MTKHEFMQRLSAKTGLTQVTLNKVYNASVEILTEELRNGGRVYFTGFGHFSSKKTKNRRLVTPQGEVVIKKSRLEPVFKFAREYVEAIACK